MDTPLRRRAPAEWCAKVGMMRLRVPVWWVGAALFTLLTAQSLALAALGHPWVCSCSFVKLWHGAVDTQNSQHLFDWYTFSHIGHGILFAAVTLLLRRVHAYARAIPWSVWLVGWVAVEAAWEVFENTPQIIALYRTNPISRHYFGDSVINSLGDTLAMIVGFAVVRRWGLIVGLVLLGGMELFTYLAVGDSLTQNILFFLS